MRVDRRDYVRDLALAAAHAQGLNALADVKNPKFVLDIQGGCMPLYPQ